MLNNLQDPMFRFAGSARYETLLFPDSAFCISGVACVLPLCDTHSWVKQAAMFLQAASTLPLRVLSSRNLANLPPFGPKSVYRSTGSLISFSDNLVVLGCFSIVFVCFGIKGWVL